MSQPRIILRFHSRKMLQTLDLGTLFDILLQEYGEPLQLQLVGMTARERTDAEDRTGPVTLVPTRFTLWEQGDEGGLVRRKDLENRIVREGRK